MRQFTTPIATPNVGLADCLHRRYDEMMKFSACVLAIGCSGVILR